MPRRTLTAGSVLPLDHAAIHHHHHHHHHHHRRAIPPDNSCLFNAVAYLCDGKRGGARDPSWKENSPAHQLRQIVANHVMLRPDIYSAAILEKSPIEYQAWILDLAKWGGGIELSILAQHYECEMIAIDIQQARPYSHGEGYEKICFLLYNGVHYDAIAFCSRDNSMLTGKDAIASENLDITTVGIADRDIALRLVIEMATKLCQTGQYTDLRRNFTVQCLQCYAKLLVTLRRVATISLESTKVDILVPYMLQCVIHVVATCSSFSQFSSSDFLSLSVDCLIFKTYSTLTYCSIQ